jgi:hypothetical protein
MPRPLAAYPAISGRVVRDLRYTISIRSPPRRERLTRGVRNTTE